MEIKQSGDLSYVELAVLLLAESLVRISILANIYRVSLPGHTWTYLLTVQSYQQLQGFVGRQF